MSEPHPILMHLGQPGQRANDIASALCALIKQDRETGALERLTVTGIDGNPRTIAVPPQAWLDRLTLAAERGAFERYTVDQITGRILTTEQAA